MHPQGSFERRRRRLFRLLRVRMRTSDFLSVGLESPLNRPQRTALSLVPVLLIVSVLLACNVLTPSVEQRPESTPTELPAAQPTPVPTDEFEIPPPPDVSGYLENPPEVPELRPFYLAPSSGPQNPDYDLDGDGLSNELELWVASTFGPVYIYDKEEHNILTDTDNIAEFRDVAYYYQVSPAHCDPVSRTIAPTPQDDLVLTVVAAYAYDYVPYDPLYRTEKDVFAHYGDTERIRICLERYEGSDVPAPKDLRQIHGAEYVPNVPGSVRRSAYAVAFARIKRHHDDPKPYATDQFEWESDTHLALYAAEGKHAAYTSDGECEDYVSGGQWLFWDEDCSSRSDNPQIIWPQSLQSAYFNVGERDQDGKKNQLLDSTFDVQDPAFRTFVYPEQVWDTSFRFCGGFYALIDDPGGKRDVITVLGKGYTAETCGGSLGGKWFETSLPDQPPEVAQPPGPSQETESDPGGSAAWAVVMTEGTGYSRQSWHTRDEFPKDPIAEKWDEDYHITELVCSGGLWAVVMTQGTGFTTQSWATRSEFPSDAIEEKWDEDFYITDLAYCNGTWAVVMTKGTGFTNQSWHAREEFPQEPISEKWDQDYHITELVYGDGQWAVVMTKGTGFTFQSYHTRGEFPRDVITEKWDEGLYITELAYGDGIWAVVMTDATGFTAQSWHTRSEYPSDPISEKWDLDYHITHLAGTGG